MNLADFTTKIFRLKNQTSDPVLSEALDLIQQLAEGLSEAERTAGMNRCDSCGMPFPDSELIVGPNPYSSAVNYDDKEVTLCRSCHSDFSDAI